MRFPFVVCRRGVAVIKCCVSFASVGCIRDSSGIRGALNQNDECKCETFGSQETDTAGSYPGMLSCTIQAREGTLDSVLRGMRSWWRKFRDV